MIEFAPNPTGPAHLGTLRSYAVGWLEAQRTEDPLFVRFDANHLQGGGKRSPQWADSFLRELEILDMPPPAWQYFTESIRTAAIPSWAVVKEIDYLEGPRPWAFYPVQPSKTPVPSQLPEDYQPGRDVVMRVHGTESTRYYFAQQLADGLWAWGEELVALVNMQLRQVTTIVRGLTMAVLRPFYEEPAHDYFGLRLPEVRLAGMVVNDAGGLCKSALKPGEYGTVGWALDRMGPAALRKAVLESAGSDLSAAPAARAARQIVHVDEICS